ncbi:hypothetical protein KA111_00765 [Candidatus Woesebacteria bacterium]|nr:hypothetical protein [Candidatus Woesebacteria bacterium]
MFESEATVSEVVSPKTEGLVPDVSPETMEKATTLSRMVEEALQKNDIAALGVLAESVKGDPQLLAAIEKRRLEILDAEGQQKQAEQNDENEKLELGKIKQAFEELHSKFIRIASLSAEAIGGNAQMESLFWNDDERSAAIQKVEALSSAVEGASKVDDVQAALDVFSKWHDDFQEATKIRTIRKRGYFDGELPQRLVVQMKKFDALKDDIDAMKRYILSAKN